MSSADAFSIRRELELEALLVTRGDRGMSLYYGDGEEHEFEIRFELSSDRLSVTIADDGVPFNPFANFPPDTALPVEKREIGGLGIHLVRNVMDEVSYNRRTDRNVVILVKYLDDSSRKQA